MSELLVEAPSKRPINKLTESELKALEEHFNVKVDKNKSRVLSENK